jgi:hypothetical protein
VRRDLSNIIVHELVDQHVFVCAYTRQVTERWLFLDHVVGVSYAGGPEHIAKPDCVAQRAVIDSTDTTSCLD